MDKVYEEARPLADENICGRRQARTADVGRAVSAALLHLCLRLCSICICGSALSVSAALLYTSIKMRAIMLVILIGLNCRWKEKADGHAPESV
jgi:hypothetical protein